MVIYIALTASIMLNIVLGALAFYLHKKPITTIQKTIDAQAILHDLTVPGGTSLVKIQRIDASDLFLVGDRS
jgi:hypothetical protein